MMVKVIYVGCSSDMLRCLLESPAFDLEGIVGEPDKVSSKYRLLVEETGIPYWEVASERELVALPLFSSTPKNVIIYKFDYILKKDIINNNVIVNFHPGNLRTNRGPHPCIWSVLKREKMTMLSMYQLTGGIDEGLLIAERPIPLSDTEDVASIDGKCSAEIPKLLDELARYFTDGAPVQLIEGGGYRPKIQKSDYTIDLQRDSIDEVAAKIRSQRGYAGAIVEFGRLRFRVKDYSVVEMVSNAEDGHTLVDNRLEIRQSGRCLTGYLLSD